MTCQIESKASSEVSNTSTATGHQPVAVGQGLNPICWNAYQALLPFPKSRFPLKGELLDPAVAVRRIDRDTTRCHPPFQVPIAQWVHQVPADTGKDDVFFEMMPFEVDHADLTALNWKRSLPKLMPFR